MLRAADVPRIAAITLSSASSVALQSIMVFPMGSHSTSSMWASDRAWTWHSRRILSTRSRRPDRTETPSAREESGPGPPGFPRLPAEFMTSCRLGVTYEERARQHEVSESGCAPTRGAFAIAEGIASLLPSPLLRLGLLPLRRVSEHPCGALDPREAVFIVVSGENRRHGGLWFACPFDRSFGARGTSG